MEYLHDLTAHLPPLPWWAWLGIAIIGLGWLLADLISFLLIFVIGGLVLLFGISFIGHYL